MQHKLWGKTLRFLLNLVMAGIIVLGISGCVEISIEADNTEVVPYEEVTLTAICTPEDTSDEYSYLWSVIEAPPGSEHYALPWKMLDSKTSVQTFKPDIPGIYEIDSKVITGTVEGMNIATITINCVSGTWIVDPTLLDFKYIQTNKTVRVTNLNEDSISLGINRSNTATWVTDIDYADTVPGNTFSEIMVSVDRAGLTNGRYETSFYVVSQQCGEVEINVIMDVGAARILFCVDTSGSMEWNDPNNKRVIAVKDTVEKFHGNEWVSFGIIDFDSKAKKLIDDFTRDKVALDQKAEELDDHDGYTNYLGLGYDTPGALDEIDDMIDENDPSYYNVVIFLSDGEPTMGNLVPDDIVDRVTQIASPGNVKLYTIFLDDGDSDLLDRMAKAGGTDGVVLVSDPNYLSFIDLDF